MNREEFLESLNMQLQGEIPSHEIAQHLTYYDSFISQETRQGKTEQEVLEELGDPHLIAKTLIDTEDIPNVHGYRQSYAYAAEEAGPGSQAREENNAAESNQGNFWQEDSPKEEANRRVYRLDLGSWKGKLAVAVGAILLVVVLALAIYALLPVALTLIIIGVVLSIINRHRQ